MSTNSPGYGQVDRDYGMRLATTPADEDGPVWMVNLMKYREVAAVRRRPGVVHQRPGGRRRVHTARRRSTPSAPSRCSSGRRPAVARRRPDAGIASAW